MLPSRVLGYDVARALAILGMVLVHFGYTLAGDEWVDSDWAIVMAFLDGRAAATFMVLAGIGVSLQANKATASVPAATRKLRHRLLRRGAFLFVAGMVLLIVWPGDILRIYGVAMVVAAALVTARSRALWVAITAFVGGFLLLFVQFEYGKNFDWENLTYHKLWTAAGQFSNLFYDGFRSVFPWTAFVIFGMWLGRHDLSRTSQTKRFLGIGLVIMALSEITSWLIVRAITSPGESSLDNETAVFLFGTDSMPPLPIFLLVAASTAVVVICGSLWISRAFQNSVVVRALAATGQLAFTWYILHIVLGLGTIVALDWEDETSLPLALAVGLVFFLGAAILSLLYQRRFNRGPMEWLLRVVTN